MNDVFHYPPDLFDLIVQTIPLLNRSKEAVLLFFKGAGVDEEIFKDLSIILLIVPPIKHWTKQQRTL